MEFLFAAVATLFVVMDPFGNIPLFITALRKVTPERRNFVLIRELCIALIIMVVFMFVGRQMLTFLGIKEYSLSIAGGLILMLISLKLIFGGSDDVKEASKDKEDEPFIVPLAIPLVAGPGALSVVLILGGQSHGRLIILASVLIASLLNFVVLLLSFPISNLLGRRGLLALERLTGMLLVLMSVNMIMNGIAKFMARAC
ncbi:MAG: MarC family protein [Elusimicrobium sp.]|jgi:multiple antibiotic resistance protein|nr:MarC family protein [Elusimicrobium sp.]